MTCPPTSARVGLSATAGAAARSSAAQAGRSMRQSLQAPVRSPNERSIPGRSGDSRRGNGSGWSRPRLGTVLAEPIPVTRPTLAVVPLVVSLLACGATSPTQPMPTPTPLLPGWQPPRVLMSGNPLQLALAGDGRGGAV